MAEVTQLWDLFSLFPAPAGVILAFASLSHSAASSSAISTAAGVSIMVPTSMFWPIFTPSAASSARHSSRMALASCSSRRLVIMGNMMLMLP